MACAGRREAAASAGYAVELDAAGSLRRAQYQGKDHVMKAFAGRREGRHPVLYVVTKNNMLGDRGAATPRTALAPVPISLEGVSREAVMDAHPWTHEVSAAEVRREGRVVDGAAPVSKRIPDPRRFAFLEACGRVVRSWTKSGHGVLMMRVMGYQAPERRPA